MTGTLARTGAAGGQPSTGVELARESVERAAAFAGASRAAATRHAYGRDWALFEAWCREVGVEPLPADARAVASFLGWLAGRGLAPLTIGRRLAAIGWAHRQAGQQPPQKGTDAALILEVMAGIRRSREKLPTKKAAADADILRDVLRAIQDDDLRSVRDRAIIAFGMASALRRSEIVALRVSDVARVPEGMRVTVRRSKTDQEGKGATIAIPEGRRLRPVALLEAWLSRAMIEEGPLFRRLDRLGLSTMDQMSDRSVARVVKSRVEAAGYDPADFAGHSLRAGFLTAAARAGASIFKMREVSRHKSLDVLSGYVRDADLFRDHAGESFL